MQRENTTSGKTAFQASREEKKRAVRPLYVDMKRDDEGHWYWRVRCGKTNEELDRGASDQIAKAYTDVTLVLTDLAHRTGKFAKPHRTQGRRG